MDIDLPTFARLIANLYRKESDDHIISLGDWGQNYDPQNPKSIFYPVAQFTVGDFRRWAPDHIREYKN